MNPLSLFLDARKLGDGGIGIYIENLVEGLVRARNNGFPIEIRLLVPTSLTEEIKADLIRWSVDVIEDDTKKYSLDEHLFLGKRLREIIKKSEIFHSPHYTLPRGIRIPSIATIHDTIHIDAPEKISQRLFGGYLVASALRRAKHVITVSGVSLARLGRVVPGIPVTVVHNALAKGIGVVPFAEVGQIINQLGITRPFILFVGSDRPHKGFRELIDALREIQQYSPSLVAVGERYSDRTKRYAAEKLGEERVHFPGSVVRADLTALYNGARAVVVSSRIEGFGLVALEALACGAPLICTPEVSLKEVAKNCAWYASGFSSSEIAEAIICCFENQDISDEKAAAGLVRVKEFSIERFAEEHIQAYLNVLPEYRARELLGWSSDPDTLLSYVSEDSDPVSSSDSNDV